jgi:hypothetical protein
MVGKMSTACSACLALHAFVAPTAEPVPHPEKLGLPDRLKASIS